MSVDAPHDTVATETGARRGSRATKVFLKSPRTIIGAVVLVVIVLAAVFADVIAPYPPNEQNLRARLTPPSAENWLGTDHFGRDVLSRIIHGGRVSLQVGVLSVGIALLIGGVMGVVAGFYGGWLDTAISGFVDVLLALPAFLLALAIVAALGPSLINVMIAVGVANVPQFARITRSAVLQVAEIDFVTAAQALGSRDRRVMFKHIVPNALGPVIVQVTLSLAGAILAAAGLSFLGLGAQPPTAEWGVMVADGKNFMTTAWWISTFPGLVLTLAGISFSLVGDGLADLLRPKS